MLRRRPLLGLTALLIVGCGGSGNDHSSPSTTVVKTAYAPFRFFNAFSGNIRAGLQVSGNLLTSTDGKQAIGFGDTLRYNASPDGTQVVAARRVGRTNTVLAETSVDFAESPRRLVVGYGSEGSRSIIALRNRFATSGASTAAVVFGDVAEAPGTRITKIFKDGQLVVVYNTSSGSIADGIVDLSKGPGRYTMTVREPGDPEGRLIAGPFEFTIGETTPLNLILFGSGKNLRLAVLPGVYENLPP